MFHTNVLQPPGMYCQSNYLSLHGSCCFSIIVSKSAKSGISYCCNSFMKPFKLQGCMHTSGAVTCRIIVAVYFAYIRTYFESLTLRRNTCKTGCVSYIAIIFWSSDLANGRVSKQSTSNMCSPFWHSINFFLKYDS